MVVEYQRGTRTHGVAVMQDQTVCVLICVSYLEFQNIPSEISINSQTQEHASSGGLLVRLEHGELQEIRAGQCFVFLQLGVARLDCRRRVHGRHCLCRCILHLQRREHVCGRWREGDAIDRRASGWRCK